MQARGNNFNGGLNDLADMLQVVRIGPQHQVFFACFSSLFFSETISKAGSDSLLTALTFFELVRKHIPGLLEEPDNECMGRIFGLNWSQAQPPPPKKPPQ
jgi:hypothetical protein